MTMIRAFVTILVTFIASLAQAMPDIKTFTTPAGTPAWLVEDHNIPFVALELRFIGGTAIEPMEKRENRRPKTPLTLQVRRSMQRPIRTIHMAAMI
ncbi:MAG: hypothetical protein EBW61_15050 [Rhodobacteraceae bacterium]|nr:hypothetical protein [Paracoccaceae bacterium]